MTYLDYGYSKLGVRSMRPKPTQYSQIQLDSMLENLGGGLINIGKITTPDGKTTIDLTNNRIIMSDGADDRVIIGFLEDGF